MNPDQYRQIQTEQLMERLGVVTNFLKPLPVADIDRSRHDAQARDDIFNHGNLAKVKAGFEAGHILPAIVVRQRDDGGLQLADGHHRCEMATELWGPEATLWAYIVTCDDDTYVDLVWQCNVEHGMPPTEAERVQHARTGLMTGRYKTRQDACDAQGLPYERFNRLNRVIDFDLRAKELGIARWTSRMSETHRDTLNQIADDDLLVEVAKSHSKVPYNAKECEQLKNIIKTGHSELERQQLARVELARLAEAYAEAKGQPPKELAGVTKVRHATTYVKKLTQGQLMEESKAMTVPERAEFVEGLRKSARKLDVLADAVEEVV